MRTWVEGRSSRRKLWMQGVVEGGEIGEEVFARGEALFLEVPFKQKGGEQSKAGKGSRRLRSCERVGGGCIERVFPFPSLIDGRPMRRCQCSICLTLNIQNNHTPRNFGPFRKTLLLKEKRKKRNSLLKTHSNWHQQSRIRNRKATKNPKLSSPQAPSSAVLEHVQACLPRGPGPCIRCPRLSLKEPLGTVGYMAFGNESNSRLTH